MTDTPLDLDAIRVRDGHLNATEDVRFLLAEVERLTYVNAEHRRRDESQDAIRQQLTTRAEKAEAQVAAVLALCDQADARLGQGNSLTPTAVRAAVDGAS